LESVLQIFLQLGQKTVPHFFHAAAADHVDTVTDLCLKKTCQLPNVIC